MGSQHLTNILASGYHMFSYTYILICCPTFICPFIREPWIRYSLSKSFMLIVSSKVEDEWTIHCSSWVGFPLLHMHLTSRYLDIHFSCLGHILFC